MLFCEFHGVRQLDSTFVFVRHFFFFGKKRKRGKIDRKDQ